MSCCTFPDDQLLSATAVWRVALPVADPGAARMQEFLNDRLRSCPAGVVCISDVQSKVFSLPHPPSGVVPGLEGSSSLGASARAFK